MATTLVRSRATITGTKDRFTWNEIKNGAVLQEDGIIVAVGNEGDTDLAESADHFISISPSNEYLLSILEVIPLQLLAYHCAVRRGCDIDQPRNLAKSVTVE